MLLSVQPWSHRRLDRAKRASKFRSDIIFIQLHTKPAILSFASSTFRPNDGNFFFSLSHTTVRLSTSGRTGKILLSKVGVPKFKFFRIFHVELMLQISHSDGSCHQPFDDVLQDVGVHNYKSQLHTLTSWVPFC